MASGGIGRRRFVNWFLGTSAGALLASVVYPIVRFLSPPETTEASANEVEAGAVNDPEFIGRGYKIVSFGGEPVIVVRLEQGDFRAFSATCTHLSCIVEYRKEKGVIWCNCHNGVFDMQGKNVAGPPPKPLDSYAVHVVDKSGTQGMVVVSRS